MSKNTDYKKLWRRSKKEIQRLQTEVQRLSNLCNGYSDILQKVRDGEINVKEELRKEPYDN